MKTTHPCVRSCTKPGTDDEFYPATHGRYCSRCWRSLDQALLQAPELASHLLGSVQSSGGQSDDRVDTTKDAPLPFNSEAFADVNELYSLLVYWCGIWADYLDVLRPAAAARAWRLDSGTVAGLPADTTPERGAHEVGRMTRWLRDRLDEILTLAPEDVDEFDAGIRDVWRMNARWPRIEKPRYSDMPCPAAGCAARIVVYPPPVPGASKSIACEAGHYYPEEEFDALAVELVARRLEAARQARADGRARQAEKQQADDVRAHLWHKYGWVDGNPDVDEKSA